MAPDGVLACSNQEIGPTFGNALPKLSPKQPPTGKLWMSEDHRRRSLMRVRRSLRTASAGRHEERVGA